MTSFPPMTMEQCGDINRPRVASTTGGTTPKKRASMPPESSSPLTPPNPSGLCMCGCGAKTNLARQTRGGNIVGHPQKFVLGHQSGVANKMEPPNPSGVCQCGCGELAPIAKLTKQDKGHVAGHPVRFVAGHGTGSKPFSRTAYIINPETKCWEWQRALSRGGYAVFGGTGRAHRLFYEAYIAPIPEGLVIDHLCRNRACVNPGHLEPVTLGENLRRGDRAKLDPDKVREIRRLHSEGASPKELAEQFGVVTSNISLIVTRKRWADV